MEKQAINGIVSQYLKNKSFWVRNAFRTLMPSLNKFQALFKYEAQAIEYYHEYFRMYDEYFQDKILKKVKGIDFNRNKIYRTSLASITPESLKPEISDLNTTVLMVDFYWPEDQLEIVGKNPIITFYFVKFGEHYKIFHSQALDKPIPSP